MLKPALFEICKSSEHLSFCFSLFHFWSTAVIIGAATRPKLKVGSTHNIWPIGGCNHLTYYRLIKLTWQLRLADNRATLEKNCPPLS